MGKIFFIKLCWVFFLCRSIVTALSTLQIMTFFNLSSLYFNLEQQVVKRMTMEKDLEDWEVYDELKGKKKGNFRIPTSGFITEVSISVSYNSS